MIARIDQKIANLGLFKIGTAVLTSYSPKGIITPKSSNKTEMIFKIIFPNT